MPVVTNVWENTSLQIACVMFSHGRVKRGYYVFMLFTVMLIVKHSITCFKAYVT